MLLFLGLCLVSRFAYSVNDILVGRLARLHSRTEVAAWRGVSLGVTMAPWLLFVPAAAWPTLADRWPDVAILLTVTAAANLMMLQASRLMPFGVRAAFVVSGIAAFSGLLGWAVLGERMRPAEIGLSVVVVGSAVLSALGRHATHEFQPDLRRGAWYAVGAAVLIACMGLMVARLSRATHPLLTAWVWEFGGGLVLFGPLALRYARVGVPVDLRTRVRAIAIASSPTVIGSGFSALALTMGSLGVWAAVAGTQVLFTAVLGVAWHRELIGPRRWACFVVAAVAIGVLGWVGTH
ncbi:MAG: DMT family transporter [Opitutaceae bacterium]|nr:DMT family transporter [Opitutaceae bacterium]